MCKGPKAGKYTPTIHSRNDKLPRVAGALEGRGGCDREGQKGRNLDFILVAVESALKNCQQASGQIRFHFS